MNAICNEGTKIALDKVGTVNSELALIDQLTTNQEFFQIITLSNNNISHMFQFIEKNLMPENCFNEGTKARTFYKNVH